MGKHPSLFNWSFHFKSGTTWHLLCLWVRWRIDCRLLLLFTFISQAHTFKVSVSLAGSHCRPRLNVLAVKHSVSQLVSAIMGTAELHCLRDNAWLTWSTSEPDILLSLRHNTTTQSDMAGPLISKAGLTDMLCAHCNGCLVTSNMPWIQWLDQNTVHFWFRSFVSNTDYSDFWVVSVAFVSMNISLSCNNSSNTET